MRNLVIIGNGFDLAHGLETSYSSYMKYVVEKHQSREKIYDKIFDDTVIFDPKEYDLYKREYKSKYANSALVSPIKNSFFEKILLEEATQNWSDIERLYFIELKSCKDYLSVKKLNEEFDVIKSTLSDYLKTQERKFNRLDAYNLLFNHFESMGTLVLNFNYTNTVKQYIKIYSRINLVHIHGELESVENPMIFGYAATESEISELLKNDINDYLFNIKKYNYKKTGDYKVLLDHLSKLSFVDVFILGHSCGSSDRLILSQIFSQKAVKSINVFYHEDFYNYKKIDIGVDRIMDEVESYSNKTDRYTECCLMPQWNDCADSIEVFKSKLKEIVTSKEKSYKREVIDKNPAGMFH